MDTETRAKWFGQRAEQVRAFQQKMQCAEPTVVDDPASPDESLSENALRSAEQSMLYVEDQLKMIFSKTSDQRVLRAKLMVSELGETIKALYERDQVALADGLADLTYVVEGTAVTFTVPLQAVFEEVHASNMTKTPGLAVANHDAARGKGPDFKPADVRNTLEKFYRVCIGEAKQPTLF